MISSFQIYLVVIITPLIETVKLGFLLLRKNLRVNAHLCCLVDILFDLILLVRCNHTFILINVKSLSHQVICCKLDLILGCITDAYCELLIADLIHLVVLQFLFPLSLLLAMISD
jgi:hypothetical protein